MIAKLKTGILGNENAETFIVLVQISAPYFYDVSQRCFSCYPFIDLEDWTTKQGRMAYVYNARAGRIGRGGIYGWFGRARVRSPSLVGRGRRPCVDPAGLCYLAFMPNFSTGQTHSDAKLYGVEPWKRKGLKPWA